MYLQMPQQQPLSQAAAQQSLQPPSSSEVSKLIKPDDMYQSSLQMQPVCCHAGGCMGMISELVSVVKQLVGALGALLGFNSAQAAQNGAASAQSESGGSFIDAIKSLIGGVKDFFGFSKEGGGVLGSIVSGIKSIF